MNLRRATLRDKSSVDIIERERIYKSVPMPVSVKSMSTITLRGASGLQLGMPNDEWSDQELVRLGRWLLAAAGIVVMPEYRDTDDPLPIDVLTSKVDALLEQVPLQDHEALHSMEDDLMKEWILHNSLFAVRTQFRRVFDADFARWCA